MIGDNRAMARKVLIVEDDEAMAVALKDGFTYEGYEVSMAADGALGLQKASEDGADLMILDVMLPRSTRSSVSSSVPTTTSPSRSASWS